MSAAASLLPSSPSPLSSLYPSLAPSFPINISGGGTSSATLIYVPTIIAIVSIGGLILGVYISHRYGFSPWYWCDRLCYPEYDYNNPNQNNDRTTTAFAPAASPSPPIALAHTTTSPSERGELEEGGVRAEGETQSEEKALPLAKPVQLTPTAAAVFLP